MSVNAGPSLGKGGLFLSFQVVEVVRAVLEHPDPSFPVNVVHQPSKVREMIDGIVGRASILETEVASTAGIDEFTEVIELCRLISGYHLPH